MPSALVSTPASLVPLARRSGAARRVRTGAHASSRGALGSSARLSSPGASIASPRGFLALDRAMPATTPSTRRRATRSGTAVRAADGDAAPAASTGGPKINLPTALTLVRVAAVPLVTVIFYMQGAWVAPTCCAIFVLAAVTDWLDGYLARKMNLVSSFGAFLDPVADKLMVAAALVLLCTKTAAGVSAISMAAPATIIIGREITMSAIREWAAAAGGEAHKAVAVNSFGKWKTATQLVALSVLLGVRDGCEWLGLAGAAADALVTGGVWCLYASAGLALLSLWIYMAGVVKYMT
jgi:CDP-diacylglycerol--glycerol-3-phosphate 3-phosphatidyltransferase